MSYSNWLRVYLPPCENCGVASKNLFCEVCDRELQLLSACEWCGKAPITNNQQRCLSCENKKLPWKQLFVQYRHERGVIRWLQSIKSKRQVARWRNLRPVWPEAWSKPSFLTYVPSEPGSTQKRGFDCSLALAQHLAASWQIPLLRGVFERKPFLRSQKQSCRDERYYYLEKCLQLSPKHLNLPKTALIVDDVMTTGASLELCCYLLQSAGVEEIMVYCVSRRLKGVR